MTMELSNMAGNLDLDLDMKTLTLTIDQDFYFELNTVFGNPLDIPIELHLRGAFVTYDPITGKSFRDPVEMWVVGSGQVESDKCDFSSLAIKAGTEFPKNGEDLTYKVRTHDENNAASTGSENTLQLLMPTTIDGVDGLTPELCRHDD
jgi:hypothetical protein